MALTSASRSWHCALTTVRMPRAGRPLPVRTGPRSCPRAPGLRVSRVVEVNGALRHRRLPVGVE
jgi:hypothetical protein